MILKLTRNDFSLRFWRPYLLVTRGNKNVESLTSGKKICARCAAALKPKYSWWRRYSAIHQRAFDRVACDQLLTVPTLDAKVEDYLSAQEIHRIDDFTQVGLHFDINIMRCNIWPLTDRSLEQACDVPLLKAFESSATFVTKLQGRFFTQVRLMLVC